ncbi:class I SAM-dependent methyltransferase [Mesobacillus foraminis]|uniref:class I SAM-dependent methyltransferase n=1 Tax=Mesobacillus foraminis TaxID=279826 RepID=UPI001BEA90D5|nr:class I SAM-dependent methyltransferase [Mesobacillus foraminis]MBT2757560.1 class I SAM-dependent methyltransferase [Mesobacillus foraminis]
MNNNRNVFIYKIWSPIYDLFFNSGAFLTARRSLFKDIPFKEGDSVLFVGVGTGADLEQIPYNKLAITAIDYSEDMLKQAKRKFSFDNILFLQMDAQHLKLASEEYDYVVASLILTVVPDGRKVFREMVRVTKKGGMILIFDKFAPENKALSPLKKFLRPLISLLGTDIGVTFKHLYQGAQDDVIMVEDQDLLFSGMYRKIRLLKK